MVQAFPRSLAQFAHSLDRFFGHVWQPGIFIIFPLFSVCVWTVVSFLLMNLQLGSFCRRLIPWANSARPTFCWPHFFFFFCCRLLVCTDPTVGAKVFVLLFFPHLLNFSASQFSLLNIAVLMMPDDYTSLSLSLSVWCISIANSQPPTERLNCLNWIL